MGREECVFVKIDQRSFFLHIDKLRRAEMYQDIINEDFADHPWHDFLLWLCRILYLSCPTEHMRRECPVSEGAVLPPHKRMENLPWWTGLAIGNLIAQIGGNLFSTLYLAVFRYFDYNTFVHYTDDTILVIRKDRLEQFLSIFMPTLREEERKVDLEMNESKFYCQDCRKGVSAIGYFIKAKPDGLVILPNRRVVHNLECRIRSFVARGTGDRMYRLKNKERFRDAINSYYGIFRHCNSFDLRKKFAGMVLASEWSEQLAFKEGYLFCYIVKRYTIKSYHTYKNKCFKKFFNHYDYTGTNQCPGE